MESKNIREKVEKQWWSAQSALYWPISMLSSVLLRSCLSGRGYAALSSRWLVARVMLSLLCRLTFRLLLLGLRIPVQSLHSLQGPPIARLSAPLSLPCASAASPLSPRSVY